MKLGEIADIYKALQKLLICDIPSNESYKIYKVIAATKEDAEFYIKKELEILNKYGKKSEFVQNQFTVSPKNIPLYQNEINELRNIENDFQIKCTIRGIPLSPIYSLSPKDIGALISFVEFIEMEENDNVAKN